MNFAKFAAVSTLTAIGLFSTSALAADPTVVCKAYVQENETLVEKEMSTTAQPDGATTFEFVNDIYTMYATYSPSLDSVAASITDNRSQDVLEVEGAKPTADANILEVVDSLGFVSGAIACQYM